MNKKLSDSTIHIWSHLIRSFLVNGTRTLSSLFPVIFVVCAIWQSSYASEHEITATLEQPFHIVLTAAIGSTGYSWSARFDENFLKLRETWYEKPKSKLVGAPGEQVFVFVPLKQGKAKIEMRLKRPWESSEIKTQVYEVSILPGK
jgi:predicted secreted protein